MIGTIRKHSKWLWAVIITATIISFIFWGAKPMGNGNGGGGGAGDLGSINGKKVTPHAYAEALNEFKLFYLFRYGTWPKANVSDEDMRRETYIRLMLIQKAAELGIHASLDTSAAMANQMLRSLGRDGKPVSMDAFTEQVLKPENLSVSDFENFVRHDIIIQQLVQAMGLPGALVTPQEATSIYEREHQELSAQIVFFSASNYLSAVTVTPENLGKFYTNYLAAYRLPDRVQVSYVAFSLSNFIAQAETELAKTNLEAQIDSVYLQYGAKAFPDAKTPTEAKAKIREMMIRQQALAEARKQANDFASAVFTLEPARAENLATIAKQKKLTVQTTTPFAAATGPEEFTAPEGFTKTAFTLTPDEPFANPIAGPDAIYVIALAKQLPSEIPPLAEIQARVTQDYRFQAARQLAVHAGTNFVHTLTSSLAAGKTFAAAAAAAGFPPQTLPPFSLSTRSLPEFEDRAELSQLKQSAFTTPIGHASSFEETADGGFVMYVREQLPVDHAVMSADLPKFTADLRRTRENEAFNQWLQAEAGRALRDTPITRQAAN